MSSDKAVQRMPIQASNVKKGTFVILKGRPCKVSEVKTSKTGKHGHAKANITGYCVLTRQKCEEVHPASHSLVEFKLLKSDYSITAIESHEQGYKISALDEEASEVEFYTNPNSELCQGAAVAKAQAENPDKPYSICVIRAPVEVTDNDFVDQELIESFREDKST